MKTVLITGGIASGKSEVSACLRGFGYPVYDSDSRTKELYKKDAGLKKRAEEAAGVPLTRSSEIFSDPARLARLEAVVHPEVLKDFMKWRAENEASVVFMESAIAYDKPVFKGLWDEIWLVRAPLEKRLERNPKAKERISSQSEPPEEMVSVIIDNDSDLESLHKKVKTALNDMKTDLTKILSVSGKHGLYRFLALSRNNSAIAEALSDSHRTVFDPHSRITTLSDIAIYTNEGEFKLKDVFLSIQKTLGGADAPTSKSPDTEIKTLFEKAVPNYDPDRFYLSHMKKILDWYNELVKYASLDFTEEDAAEGEEA